MTDVSESQQRTIELFRNVPFFSQLAPEVLGELTAISSCCRFQPGVMIFCEGDPTAGLYVIEKGSVKVSRFTEEGREHILNIFRDGDTFNDVSALDGGPNPATATAFSEVRLWRITREDLRQVAGRHPELTWALLESVATRTRFLVGLVENLAVRTVKGRLAHLLLEQAARNETSEVPRQMTHEEMANHLGTVREMIGRALSSFAAAGIIEVERHRIIIHDAKRLAAEAAA